MKLQNNPAYQIKGIHRRLLTKLIWITVLFVVIFCVVKIFSRTKSESNSKEPNNCFRVINQPHMDFLDDILKSKRKPTNGQNIFFLETSCAKDGRVHLTPRQGCAIESAARQNPNLSIFTIFASPVGYIQEISSLSAVLQALQSYQNVYLRNVNISELAAGTPAANWFKSGQLFTSKYLREHASDFLRILVLYRFGGIYLDLDFVVFEEFNTTESIFFAAESDSLIGNSILSMPIDGIGHEIANLLLREYVETFNGIQWSWNGPKLITRVASRICRTPKTSSMTLDRCNVFKVHPQNDFYPIGWQSWDRYFKTQFVNETLKKVENATAVHVWNHMVVLRNGTLEKGAAYSVLASRHCPKVYEATASRF